MQFRWGWRCGQRKLYNDTKNMQKVSSIDLLPDVPEEEIIKAEKKGKMNIFAIFSIVFIGTATVLVLLANLAAQLEQNVQKEMLAKSRQDILDLQYVEIKQRTFNVKMDTYRTVVDHDFSSDVVLQYLLDVAGRLSTVRSMYLDDTMNFTVSGTADSYLNVARIWHDMSKQKDYFENVNLTGVSKDLDAPDPSNGVTYNFSGTMIKENVDNL
jgi:hypothetical protein